MIFWKLILPPISGLQNKTSKKLAEVSLTCCLLLLDSFLILTLKMQQKGNMFPWKIRLSQPYNSENSIVSAVRTSDQARSKLFSWFNTARIAGISTFLDYPSLSVICTTYPNV
jgi:hypothetical protein